MSTTKFPVSDTGMLAPLGQWHDHDQTGHVAQFYANDAFLLDSLSRFVGTALVAGDAAIVIATEAHRDGLAQRLKARGLDTAVAVKRGLYVPLDAVETLSTFMVDGWPDAARFADVIGGIIARGRAVTESENDPRVAIFGEMVALLWAAGKAEAAIRLEQFWNELADTHSFSLRCAYPMTSFYREEHGELFLRICAEHSGVIPDESYMALVSDEERLRNITHLQQKEQAHEALRRTKKELEKEVAERTKAERKLHDSEQSLRKLSLDLLRTQDEERRRIGRDLHDSVGQYLAVLKMNLDSVRYIVGPNGDKADRQLAECVHLAEEAINEVRTISYLLYPPMLEEIGLKSAIPWYLEGFAKRSGIKTTSEIASDFGRLPSEVELGIFRVLQETLTNIHRHSGSPTAHVRLLMKDGAVSLEVKDKGKGIPSGILDESCQNSPGTRGVGLRSMSERMLQLGGKLELSSTQEGTTVSATVPCGESSSAVATSANPF